MEFKLLQLSSDHQRMLQNFDSNFELPFRFLLSRWQLSEKIKILRGSRYSSLRWTFAFKHLTKLLAKFTVFSFMVRVFMACKYVLEIRRY